MTEAWCAERVRGARCERRVRDEICTSYNTTRSLRTRGSFVRSSFVAHLPPGACATGAEYVEGVAGWPYTGCGGCCTYWGCCPYIAICAGGCMAIWGAPPWMA